MPCSQYAPQEMAYCNRPAISTFEIPWVMEANEQHLISCNLANDSRAPATHRGIPNMVSHSTIYILPGVSIRRTAKSKLHILEVRDEALVERPNEVEQRAAEDSRGHWRDVDGSRLRPERAVGAARAGAPRAECPRDQIVSAVDVIRPMGFQAFAGREPDGGIGEGLRDALEPVRRELDVVVENRDDIGIRLGNAAIHGSSEARVPFVTEQSD